MKEVNEAIYAKEKDKHWLKDHGYTKGKKMCVLYKGEYYEDCPITDVTERTKSVEIYIPQLDEKVTVHYSMLDEGLNPSSIVDTLRYMKAENDQRKAEKAADKYTRTGKTKYYKKASDYFDKAEDGKLLATAPHANKSDAKAYIKNRRDEINMNRYKDYVENGVDKEYYEDDKDLAQKKLEKEKVREAEIAKQVAEKEEKLRVRKMTPEELEKMRASRPQLKPRFSEADKQEAQKQKPRLSPEYDKMIRERLAKKHAEAKREELRNKYLRPTLNPKEAERRQKTREAEIRQLESLRG